MIRRPRRVTEFDHLRSHMERIWDHVMEGSSADPGFCQPGLLPPVDVFQAEESVFVLVELAGLRGSEIDVQIEGLELTIRGTKQEPRRPEGARYTQMEIVCGTFERTVGLPVEASTEGATVEYANGYLQLRLPRVQRLGARRVRVAVRRV